MTSDKGFGVYVGRFNPLHLGHIAVIRSLIETYGEQTLLIIGSSNAPTSLRHFFSYDERKKFIKAVFPDIKVVGLPDYGDDTIWLSALDDILIAAGFDPSKTTFFGGCSEDLRFFEDANRNCSFMNRFDGTTPKVSATEVRDALILGRPLDGLVDPAISSQVKQLFDQKWEVFKKM